MARFWQKARKRLIRTLLPPLRWVSPRLATRVLVGMGHAEHALSPACRLRFDTAVRRWASHLGGEWNVPETARCLAGNEPRWLSRDLVLDGLTSSQFDALFRVQNQAVLDAALSAERGVILLAAHYGSHLVPLHWLLRKNYPLRVYMERPNSVSSYLARQFAEDGPLGQARLFVSRGSNASESAQSVLRAVRILRAGMVLCLAGDVRWSGPNTTQAHFLGRAYTFTATWVMLAAMSRAPVVPVFCRMAPDGSFDLEFQDAFFVPSDAVATGQVPRYVQRCLDAIEAQLRADPSNGNEYVNWLESPPARSRVAISS